MNNASGNTNPSKNIPQITSLSIAFPMRFEENKAQSPSREQSPNPAPKDSPRPPHRHDAGE
jgi:hypothetical protein